MDENIELILLARQGNNSAFDKLCEKYDNLISSMSRKYSAMCDNEFGIYDDFLQEAKIAFYNAIVKYDAEKGKVTFGAFAKVCVRNRLISCVRKRKSKKRLPAENASAEEEVSFQDTVVRRELSKELFALLSKYEKRVFILHYQKRKKVVEISRELGKSERSVHNALYRISVKRKTVKQ